MRGGGLKTPKYVFHPSPIGGITEPAKAGADPGGGVFLGAHTGFTDYDEACKMHLTPGVVHNFPKAVGL